MYCFCCRFLQPWKAAGLKAFYNLWIAAEGRGNKRGADIKKNPSFSWLLVPKRLTLLFELKTLVSRPRPLTVSSHSSGTELFVEAVLISSDPLFFCQIKDLFHENMMMMMMCRFSLKELSLVLKCCVGPCGAATSASRQVHQLASQSIIMLNCG